MGAWMDSSDVMSAGATAALWQIWQALHRLPSWHGLAVVGCEGASI